MNVTKFLIAIGLVITSLLQISNAQASDNLFDSGSKFRLVGYAGLSYGGDKLAGVRFSDGSTANPRAGSGIQASGGFEYRLTSRFSIGATVGYHFEFINASNGSITFERFPLEILGHYRLSKRWRIGGGFRAAFSPKLSGERALGQVSTRFETAVGAVFEIERAFTKHLGIKVRLATEQYKPKTGYQTEYSGDQIGVFVTGYY